MQNKFPSIIFLFLLLSTLLYACQDQAQNSNKKENLKKVEPNTINNIPGDHRSSLRPNEKIEQGKIYIDTVSYLKFNTDYDDWLFIVVKNRDTIALVYNKEQAVKFAKGERIAINWKLDSLRYAGDSEALDITEFLISSEKTNASGLSVVQGREKYFTLANKGLIVRKEPGTQADRIGKIPYGSIVELLEETEIELEILDDGNTIAGFWAKIKFYNAPYKISESDEYKSEEEGYVFSGFMEKLNKASMETKEIDSLKFHALYKSTASSSLKKITAQKEMEHLLSSTIKWKKSDHVEGPIIDKVILNEGQALQFVPDDLYLLAYYPTEEILLMEGGHGSEFSLSIKTGESLETVGNPEYIIESPNKKIRLNGWFPGQECSNYFFQERSGDKHIYLIDFGWGSEQYGKDVCYLSDFCWLNDGEFLYSYTDYSGGKKRERYCTGQINY